MPLEFVSEVPPRRGGDNKGRGGPKVRIFEVEAAELRTRPNCWAILSRCETQLLAARIATKVRHGDIAAFRPAGTFEATSRTVDGEFRVYARYVSGFDANWLNTYG